jgi:hypothetical protein
MIGSDILSLLKYWQPFKTHFLYSVIIRFILYMTYLHNQSIVCIYNYKAIFNINTSNVKLKIQKYNKI